MTAIEEYEQSLAKNRRELDSMSMWKELESGSPEFMAAFLVYYASLGVQMTTRWAHWTRAAGDRCIATGFADVGQALLKQEPAKVKMHDMLVRDARSLCTLLGSYGIGLDVEVVLNDCTVPAIQDYIDFNEEIVIQSPYARLAIEHEIGGNGRRNGPRFINPATQTLGNESRKYLSFIAAQAVKDTPDAQGQPLLASFLREHPDALPALIDAGGRALSILRGCYLECVGRARLLVRTVRPSTQWDNNALIEFGDDGASRHGRN